MNGHFIDDAWHPRQQQRQRHRQQGLSLVELMIAAAITMVACLLMLEALTIGENAKRSASSGNDGMRSGLIGLDQLSFLTRTAGAGLTQSPGSFGCLINAYSNYGTQALPSSGTLPAPFAGISTAALRMAPVTVFDGGADPDVLMVMDGSSSGASLAIPRGTPQVGGDRIAVTNTVGLKQNDVLLLTQFKLDGAGQSSASDCYLTQIKAASADIDANQYLTANPLPVAGNEFSAPTGVLPTSVNYTMATLGNTPQMLLLGVLRSANGRSDLVSYDLLRKAGPTVIAENVVDFQVLYGVDDTVTGARNVQSDIDYFGDGAVDQWTAATGDWAWSRLQQASATGTPMWTGAERVRRIKSLRIALVTVDSQVSRDPLERTSKTISMFQSAGGALQIDRPLADSGVFDRHSRYQVFESIVPIRNLSGGLSPVSESLLF